MSDVVEVVTLDDKRPPRKKKYKCRDCSYATHSHDVFVSHALYHLNNNDEVRSSNSSIDPYSLSLSEIIKLLCNEIGSSDQDSVNRIEEVYNCSECSFESKDLKCLKLHSQIHATVQKCTECTFEIDDKGAFKNHLITHVSINKIRTKKEKITNKINKTYSQKKNEEEYKCEMCDFKANFCSKLVSHLLQHFKGKKGFEYIATNLDKLKDYSLSEIISIIYNDESEVNQDRNLSSDTKLSKCFRCSFECSDEEELLKHSSSHYGELKFLYCQPSLVRLYSSTFKCSECSYESSDVVALKLHSCLPNSDKVFKCLKYCKFKFETRNIKHFILHNQIHQQVRKCTECDFSHHRKSHFKNHLMIHLPEKLYTCSECSYKTNLNSKFKTHLLNHTGTNIFHCTKCDYKTNDEERFNYHNESHAEFRAFRCSECEYSSGYSAILKLHILNHHGLKKKFVCAECNYGCNYEKRMEEHMLQHSSEKRYKCTKCDFGSNYKRCMKAHEASRHGVKYRYSCPHCDFKCYLKCILKKHIVIHGGPKLQKCPHCSYECHQNLKLHIQNMHRETKMYKCSECSYEGNHKSNFITHTLTHSSERKYKCSECSFSSKHKDNLKVHMTTHMKEKLFKCADCPYECGNKYQLRRHVLQN